ncbi:GIY-YIG nuclease family protein [Cohnella rhizosphaerae]|uniref:GIY-YIG nuclease family protein n=1 Tax=Cohnella rhizosphaerae TaxID=1457232 RepID=A0A9X4QSP7_9BACL|nr:GIY-YIG nuclease family protein [Cohnella rhizosphaerae]MDG0808797.1 GIY-YIG nuclease family protein [Cohnella rhizosphaerae]
MPAFLFEPARYPEQPGVYIMKNDEGRVLYVGKSKCIRDRLRAYFNGADKRRRIPALTAEIAEIGFIVVNNEHESLVLENNLIKIHKPPYNRALKKDNSGYAYLQLTREPLPRLIAHYRDRRAVREESGEAAFGRSLGGPAESRLGRAREETAAAGTEGRDAEGRDAAVRDAVAGGAALRSSKREVLPAPAADDQPPERFGPFVSSRFREAVIAFVTEHYKLRTCVALPKRACLEYHLGKCSGVCAGHISHEEYRETARAAARLLAGGGERLVGAMYRQMEAYAERLAFEKAEHMLRHIRILERTPERQIVDTETDGTQEAVYFGESDVCVAQFHEGMLHRLECIPWSRGEEGAAACDRFLMERYKTLSRPDEIIASEIGDARLLRAALRRRGQPAVRITVPQRGMKRDLLGLCRRNLEETKRAKG